MTLAYPRLRYFVLNHAPNFAMCRARFISEPGPLRNPQADEPLICARSTQSHSAGPFILPSGRIRL
jgi:hypothetical protein